MKIVARTFPPRTAWALEQAGIHPLLAQLYAARGVQGTQELDQALTHTPGLARDLLNALQDELDAKPHHFATPSKLKPPTLAG